MTDYNEDNRLRVLRSTQLLDSSPEPSFDRLTRLAAGVLSAPVALVSLVDERRQFFKSVLGLSEPWASRRETPLTHSFCKIAVSERRPLVVEDAREHPELRDNLAIRDLSVVAYAGVPLIIKDEAIGALCVIDSKPRGWAAKEVELLMDLAESVVAEIQLRDVLREERDRRALTEALIESLGDGVLAMDMQKNFLVVNAAARRVFEAKLGEPVPADWSSLHDAKKLDGKPLASQDGALLRALRGLVTDGLVHSLHAPTATDTRWVEASGRPVRNSDGAVIAGVAVYRDVTQRLKEEALIATMVSNLPPNATLLIFDQELRCTAMGASLREQPLQAVGRTMAELAGLALDDPQFAPLMALYQNTLRGNAAVLDHTHNGRIFELRTAPIRDPLGRITAGMVLALDFTTERRNAAALLRSEQIYRAIVHHIPNGGVFMVDRELRVVAADGAMVAQHTGSSSIMHQLVTDVLSEEHREEMRAMFAEALAGKSSRYELQRGTQSFETSVVPICDKDQVITHAIAFLYDVTERKRLAERELTLDVLTGITNRRGAEIALKQEDERRRRAGTCLSVAVFDVDHFKAVNDSHGHATGDAVLRMIASTLTAKVRTGDVPARWGGEEFLVVLPVALDGARAFAERARAAVAGLSCPPVERVTISAGIAELGAAESPMEAIARADEWLYEAKKRGRNCVMG